jgi:SARP family transcriptional regulator, regulator of embCAB operon
VWGSLVAQDKDVRFKLNLFQRWQLTDGQAEVSIASRQQRVVSALAIYGARNRSYISGLLWPNSTEPRAMESLRVSLHLLSRQVPGLIVTDGLVLSLTTELKVDVHDFLRQAKYCEQPDAYGSHADCLSYLLHAELLPGWYEDWVVFEQERIRRVRLCGLLTHAKRWLEREEAEKAIHAAGCALELEPLHETCVRYLMQAELRMGNRAGALRTFRSFQTRLSSDLGLVPSDHLSNFAAAIRGG